MRYGHFGVLSVNYSYTQSDIGMLMLLVISSSTDVNVPGWGEGGALAGQLCTDA